MISLINSDNELFGQMMDLPNISDFVNLKDRHGTTSLHTACHQKNLPNKVYFLIKNGAKKMVDLKDRNGIAVLHAACQRMTGAW